MLPPEERDISPIKVSVGGHYKNIKNGEIYVVIGRPQMKNPQTRDWEDAVSYMKWPIEDIGRNPVYVREERDFRSKFKVHNSSRASKRAENGRVKF
jgi:hypothetical protein